MGGRLPLHTTGVGKALLAYQSDEFLARFFARPLRDADTALARQRVGGARRAGADPRHTGYSVTNQEMTLGNSSLAVPIFVGDGPPFAAVGFVTHLAQIRPAAQRAAAEGCGGEDRQGARRTLISLSEIPDLSR